MHLFFGLTGLQERLSIYVVPVDAAVTRGRIQEGHATLKLQKLKHHKREKARLERNQLASVSVVEITRSEKLPDLLTSLGCTRFVNLKLNQLKGRPWRKEVLQAGEATRLPRGPGSPWSSAPLLNSQRDGRFHRERLISALEDTQSSSWQFLMRQLM